MQSCAISDSMLAFLLASVASYIQVSLLTCKNFSAPRQVGVPNMCTSPGLYNGRNIPASRKIYHFIEDLMITANCMDEYSLEHNSAPEHLRRCGCIPAHS